METSPAGESWTVQLEHDHTWDLGVVQMGFGVIVSPTTIEFDEPQFDSVNVVP